MAAKKETAKEKKAREAQEKLLKFIEQKNATHTDNHKVSCRHDKDGSK